MIVGAIVIASMLAGLGAWLMFRSRRRNTSDSSLPSRPKKPMLSGMPPDAARAGLANNLMTERLWKLAFAAPSEPQAADPAQAKIGDEVCAILQKDTLDPKYFPRRPSLMPQLLRAVRIRARPRKNFRA